MAFDLAFRAVQATDAAKQVRKALQIARALELPAVHDGREAHHLGVRFAIPRDQRRKPLHDVFIKRGAAIDPWRAHPVEQHIGDLAKNTDLSRFIL